MNCPFKHVWLIKLTCVSSYQDDQHGLMMCALIYLLSALKLVNLPACWKFENIPVGQKFGNLPFGLKFQNLPSGLNLTNPA